LPHGLKFTSTGIMSGGPIHALLGPGEQGWMTDEDYCRLRVCGSGRGRQGKSLFRQGNIKAMRHSLSDPPCKNQTAWLQDTTAQRGKQAWLNSGA
jgi:hypothetical protein